MQSAFMRALGVRAGGAVALLVGGALLVVRSPSWSWSMLAGLCLHLVGLLGLYSVILLWMRQFPSSPRERAVPWQQDCSIAFVRLLLILVLLASAAGWIWSAVTDLNEVRLLLVGGQHTEAQVIGGEIVSRAAQTGYIHYAYRASPTLSIEDRFAVPRAEYSRYHIGQPLRVTWARQNPEVHRLGDINGMYLLKRLLYWLLLLLNGAAYLLLPLWLLEFRRRPAKPASL